MTSRTALGYIVRFYLKMKRERKMEKEEEEEYEEENI